MQKLAGFCPRIGLSRYYTPLCMLFHLNDTQIFAMRLDSFGNHITVIQPTMTSLTLILPNELTVPHHAAKNRIIFGSVAYDMQKYMYTLPVFCNEERNCVIRNYYNLSVWFYRESVQLSRGTYYLPFTEKKYSRIGSFKLVRFPCQTFTGLLS